MWDFKRLFNQTFTRIIDCLHTINGLWSGVVAALYRMTAVALFDWKQTLCIVIYCKYVSKYRLSTVTTFHQQHKHIFPYSLMS